LKKAIYTRVEDFLCDDDFIRYAMEASTDKDSYWATYLTAAPAIRSAYLKAYDILTHLDECELLTTEQVSQLKLRIMHSIHQQAN
jgi:hypothetical protein